MSAIDLSAAIPKLDDVVARHAALADEMADPECYLNPERLRKVGKERAELDETVTAYQEYRRVVAQLADSEDLLRDDDLKDLAQEDVARLTALRADLELRLMGLLVPRDPLDSKDVYLEIRAGTGGDEAALFVAALFRLYCRYAEQMRWRVEVVSESATELRGYREVIAMISGDRVFSRLKWEGGVHRVQRIPLTEAQGRIHTSTVTVAVLPEADDVGIEIAESDLRIDLYRASGAGGQHVNRTDSAVRLTHIPTGIVVTCQDERSQHKNRARAMSVLRARLFEQARAASEKEIQDSRRAMVGSGERSERIRTYNFPQNRLTDHRIGLTLYKLEQVMEGDIDGIITALQAFYAAQELTS